MYQPEQGQSDSGNNDRGQSVSRLMALLLCVCFLAVSLLSITLIQSRANHEHDHNGPGRSCETCNQVLAAEKILKHFVAVIVGAVAAFLCRYMMLSVDISRFFVTGFDTPVQLKVRQNN